MRSKWPPVKTTAAPVLGYSGLPTWLSINQSIRNVECLLWVSTSKFKTHECHRQDVSETSFVWTSTYLSVTFQVTQYYIVQESFPRLSQGRNIIFLNSTIRVTIKGSIIVRKKYTINMFTSRKKRRLKSEKIRSGTKYWWINDIFLL